MKTILRRLPSQATRAAIWEGAFMWSIFIGGMALFWYSLYYVLCGIADRG